ncbi:MAG: amino acid--[acyl-carrier-protein] ligase [Acidimicrobiales bacterium]
MSGDPHVQLRDRLLEAGLLFATSVEGLYARSQTYQDVVHAIDAMVHCWGRELDATMLHLPPILARSTFDSTNYVQSFPDLMGSVHVFTGNDRDHAELVRRLEANGNWPALLVPGDVVLSSAACHALYPMVAGRLCEGGRHFEVNGFCFRHEPSADPARMQAFSMHEVVYVGDPDTAQRHRDEGLKTGLSLLGDLGLEVTPVPANDPFFGRLGTALAAGQLEEELKLEGVTPIFAGKDPTAIISGNCHRDHFGLPFGIQTASGEVAHSACVAFGVDRVTVALLARHGLDPDAWPATVRERLFS